MPSAIESRRRLAVIRCESVRAACGVRFSKAANELFFCAGLLTRISGQARFGGTDSRAACATQASLVEVTRIGKEKVVIGGAEALACSGGGAASVVNE